MYLDRIRTKRLKIYVIKFKQIKLFPVCKTQIAFATIMLNNLD